MDSIVPKNNKCTVGVIYRHPHQNLTTFQEKMEHPHQNLTTFQEKMEQSLGVLNKGLYFIVGDLNINLLMSSINSIKEYTNMIYSHRCIPIIAYPTRVTESSSTLIDHI